MADRDNNRPMLTGDEHSISTWFKEFFSHFSLAWNLVWDPQVPFVAKLIPMATVAYLILPVDLVPDVALGLGQLDDLAIFLIGLKLFIDVCPPELVKRYRSGAGPVAAETPVEIKEESIIDLESKIPTEDEQKPEIPDVPQR